MVQIRIHNVIDYFAAALLLVSPWLIGFASLAPARTLFLIAGAGLAISSLITDYDFALIRKLPLGVHMTLDTVLGLLLILAPALFDYRARLMPGQYAVHVIFGVAIVGHVALTKPKSEIASRDYALNLKMESKRK